jgi:hypothetical protein
VIGLCKGKAVALNDTVLEYKDTDKQRTSLVKKLKANGLVVSLTEPPQPRKRALNLNWDDDNWDDDPDPDF